MRMKENIRLHMWTVVLLVGGWQLVSSSHSPASVGASNTASTGHYDYGVYYPFPGDQMAQESGDLPPKKPLDKSRLDKSASTLFQVKTKGDLAEDIKQQRNLVTVASYGHEPDLQVGLAFTIPFLSLPVKKFFSGFGGVDGLHVGHPSYDHSGYDGGFSGGGGYDLGGLFKFNYGGVGMAAVVALLAILVVPKLIQVLTGYNTSPYGFSGFGRSVDGDATSGEPSLMARVDEALSDFHVNSTSCVQRAVCTYVRSATEKNLEGTAGSMEKIIDGITGNGVMTYLLGGTSVMDAIKSGKKGENCAAAYDQCPVTTHGVYKFITSFLADNKV